MVSPELKFAAETDIGRKYKHNEDYYILPEENGKYSLTKEKKEKKGSLFVLCDGMGGAKSGEIASELTSGWIVKDFYNSDSKKTIPEKLKDIISDVSKRIYLLASEHDQYKGMCTTTAAVHIEDSFLSVCSVGDSRVYLLRDKKLHQLSEDHSEIWNLYKSGSITKEELRTHPRSNVLSLAIGAKEKIKPEEVFSYSGGLENKDIIMLCSDGLTDMVPEDYIEKILVSGSSLNSKCQKLVKEANKNGGKDNITVILIQVKSGKRFIFF